MGSNLASIDIVIPCYQYGRFLPECVKSVLDQGMDNLRVLIIDNASTDNSVAVARKLMADDPRIQLIARPVNLGYHASFNEGVDWASSDYFAVVNADDIIPPGSLKRAVSFMEQHPDVCLTIGKEAVFTDGEALPIFSGSEEANWRLFSGSDFISSRCGKLSGGMGLVRTSVQKSAGHYRKELLFTCDVEMFLRLATFGSVAETDAIQSCRRMHGSNMCNVHNVDRARDLQESEKAVLCFFANEGRNFPGGAELKKAAVQHLSETAYWWGIRELAGRRWRSGARLLRFAFQRRPKFVALPPLGYLCQPQRPIHNMAKRAKALAGLVFGR
jgi:glycosyltransferase involved in cell wall biosynthesis